MKTVGLIVNPVAGMGGRVGLKGTDGPEILAKALELGAKPRSQDRAVECLSVLAPLKDSMELVTCPRAMGEDAAVKSGFSPQMVGAISGSTTTAADTREAAKLMARRGVDLLLFVGGDGTARDIYSAVGNSTVVLGVPAGVKIHSAVYACNPLRAGELASLYLQGSVKTVREAEVMDVDEESYRRGTVQAVLYGYLKVPYDRRCLQTAKSGSPVSERYAQEAIAHDVVESMSDDYHYIIGPGSTTRAVLEKLNLDGTLLGIDMVYRKKLVGKDLNEAALLQKLRGRKARLIITPIGGQGYLFGRGNQQLSPAVIKRVGKENIVIIATRHKLGSLCGRPLLVDTGDRETDRMLDDYFRIVTGHREAVIYRVTL